MVADRNGEPLAISTPVESIWASPDDVEMSAQQGVSWQSIGMAPAEINAKLKGADRNFLYLKRQ